MRNLRTVGATKVVLGPVRLCYTHLFTKWASEGAAQESARYGCVCLIPKSEKDAVDALKSAIKAAEDEAVHTKWRGRRPMVIDSPLKDGDAREGEEFHGCWYLNAKASTRPGVVDRDCQPVTDEEEIYSGIYANVSIGFYGYDVSGNKGVAAGLNNVQKVRDGERFGGRVSPGADFGQCDASGEEEDDL